MVLGPGLRLAWLMQKRKVPDVPAPVLVSAKLLTVYVIGAESSGAVKRVRQYKYLRIKKLKVTSFYFNHAVV